MPLFIYIYKLYFYIYFLLFYIYFLLSMLIFGVLKLVSFLSLLSIPRRDTDRRCGCLCSHPALSTWGRCFCCYVKLKAPVSVSQTAFLSGILLPTRYWGLDQKGLLSLSLFFIRTREKCAKFTDVGSSGEVLTCPGVSAAPLLFQTDFS